MQTVSLSSGAQVVSITELLEQIILNLPSYEILPIQRVSHQFQAVICGSSSIQRSLFMCADDNGQKKIVLNPAIDRNFSMSVMDDRAIRIFHLTRASRNEPDKSKAEFAVFQIGLQSFRARYKHTKTVPPGSWDRMYLTQPPCRISSPLTKRNVIVLTHGDSADSLPPLTIGELNVLLDRLWMGKTDGKGKPKTDGQRYEVGGCYASGDT